MTNQLLKLDIQSIKLNNVEQKTSLLPRIKDITFSQFSTNQANTLDINFILPNDALIISPDPEINNKIRIVFKWVGDLLAIDTLDCSIDRNEINVFENVEFVGSQGYNFGLGLSDAVSTNSTDNSTTEGNVTIGGSIGKYSGEFTLSEAIGIVASEINASYNLADVTTPDANFGEVGWSGSRALNKAITASNWADMLKKLAETYGFYYKINQPTESLKDASIEFKRISTLITSPSALTINKSELISQANFKFDYSQVFKKIWIKFPVWRWRTEFGISVIYSETWVLVAEDNRLSDNYKSTKDLMKEGFLYGYRYATSTTPVQTTETEAKNALARLYGAVNQYNQRTFLCDFNVIGKPQLQPNNVITLSGFNSKINGNWLINECVHTINSKGWTTNIKGYKIENFTMGEDSSNDIQWIMVTYEDWEQFYRDSPTL